MALVRGFANEQINERQRGRIAGSALGDLMTAYPDGLYVDDLNESPKQVARRLAELGRHLPKVVQTNVASTA